MLPYSDWQYALTIGIIQLLFFTTDILILTLLPLWRISFGPWKAQFFPLALPRALATLVLGLLGLVVGWQLIFVLFMIVQAIGTAALIWGAIIEPGRLSLSELNIKIDRDAESSDPIRILHISDLHIELLSRREEQLIHLIDEAQADLILLTGDYINLSYNKDAGAYRRVGKFLARLQAPYGVYASLGTLAVDLRSFIVPMFKSSHVNLLCDSYQSVTVGKKGQLALIGIDCTHDIGDDAAVLQRVVNNIPSTLPKIMLYHSPELMPQAIDLGIELYLCGHTHGGQVRLPLIGPIMTGSQLGRRYVMGFYEEKDTKLYVSRGVGFEGLSAPRVRFLAPPEVTLVRIEG